MDKISFVFCLLFYIAAGKHEQYEGHALYNVYVRFADQIEVIQNVEAKYYLDVWSEAVMDRPMVILVPGHVRNSFEKDLEEAGIDFAVDVENIKEKLDLEDSLLASAAPSYSYNRSRAASEGLSFDVIHPFEVVDRYLVDLANAHPNTVTVRSAGRSIEGRDIKYLRISSTNFQDSNKPIVMIESLLHCREWVSLSATLYAIRKLVHDVTDADLVRDVDWIIVPVVNPDGYVFTHSNNRFWRKNRARGFMIGDFCMGVDLNRNFDAFWGSASSNNFCAETFHGRGPFSEPETSAIRNLLTEYGSRVAVFLDIHSFGSMILFGYGNGNLPPNALFLNLLGVRMAQAIDAVKWPQNRNYIVGNIAHVLYSASGGASDFAMLAGAEYSYTYELPAYNNIENHLNGFLVDPAFIEQAGFETWEGIKVAARYVVQNWRSRAGH